MTHNTLTDTDLLVVIVTGADTGFGKEIVEDLYQRGGYTVYATCLTNESVQKYQAEESTRLRAIQIDVTKQDDINRLRAQIEAECPQGVYCVVNNAGILSVLVFLHFICTEMHMPIFDCNQEDRMIVAEQKHAK
jgi:NAD(P)-dependent dehydrogenase (short-subunit alcohol dehydrogenase family)